MISQKNVQKISNKVKLTVRELIIQVIKKLFMNTLFPVIRNILVFKFSSKESLIWNLKMFVKNKNLLAVGCPSGPDLYVVSCRWVHLRSRHGTGVHKRIRHDLRSDALFVHGVLDVAATHAFAVA